MRAMFFLLHIAVLPSICSAQPGTVTADRVSDRLLRLINWRERWIPEGLPDLKLYRNSERLLIFWSANAANELSGLCSETARRCMAAMAPSASSVITERVFEKAQSAQGLLAQFAESGFSFVTFSGFNSAAVEMDELRYEIVETSRLAITDTRKTILESRLRTELSEVLQTVRCPQAAIADRGPRCSTRLYVGQRYDGDPAWVIGRECGKDCGYPGKSVMFLSKGLRDWILRIGAVESIGSSRALMWERLLKGAAFETFLEE